MLMASQQGVSRNADGIAAGGQPQCLWHRSRGVSHNADGIAAGGLASMLMESQQGG